MTLDEEAAEAERLLSGKSVSRVWRHRGSEVVLEFSDGTRLFVDGGRAPLELSVTNGDENSN